MVEDAYVLCEDGRIAAAGRDARPRPARRRRRGARRPRALCAIPGLVDCHTHACFAGDRVEEFALRAAGATYEELHAAGGGILSTVRATRAAGEEGLAEAVERHRGWMLRAGHDHLRGEVRATASTATPSSRSSGRSRRPAGSRPGSARTPSRPSSRTPTRTSTSRSPRSSRRRRSSPRRRTSSSSAAPSTPTQARRYLTACRDAGLALRLHGDQFTEQGAIPLAVELGARSVDHLEATGRGRASRRWPRATSPACCFRRARSSSTGRCRLPARSSTPGAAVALATDFNPGSAFCESLPLVCSLAATQLQLVPAEALAACTVNAAHVLGRADRKGRHRAGLRRRPRPPRRARLALPRLPPRPRPRRRRRARRREAELG